MQRKELSFKGQRIFIGIDVHKDSWRVAIAPEVGIVKGHSQQPSAKGLLDLLQRRYPGGEYHAVYESGFSGFSTYYALQDVGIDCIVIHAADVPTTQYEETMKTDKVDAFKLVRSLKAGLLRGIYIHGRDNIDARSVVRIRKNMQKALGGCKSRVKHLLHSNGVIVPVRFSNPGSHWSRAFIKWLKDSVVLLSGSRSSLDLLIGEVELLRRMLLEATRTVRELSRSASYSEDYKLLTSVPGIGLIVAMTLLTEIGDIRRFHNERKFASYVGLVPTSHSSGEKIAHGEMTFRGNRWLGTQLIEASWIGIGRDLGLGCAYADYKKRMKPQEAIVRVARKLSNIIFSVLKSRRGYEPYEWVEIQKQTDR